MRFRAAKTPLWRRFTSSAAILGAVAFLLFGGESTPSAVYDQQLTAARLMHACLDTLGITYWTLFSDADVELDPNRTGLIGVEFSPITTTLGSLKAKRTSTNPDFAALLVRWFHQIGAREEDIIAVGSSGSFPALALATMCAAEAMQLRPIVITSLGASGFGANRPEWTYLDMEKILYEKGMICYRSRAASPGGAQDRGKDLTAEGRNLLAEAARRCGVPLIQQPALVENVRLRADIYRQEDQPKIFVNIGGAQINVGDYDSERKLSPGPNPPQPLESEAPESMVAYFTALGVPTIHLLGIERMAREYGISIDPHPLPEPGLSLVYYHPEIPTRIWVPVTILILGGWALLIRLSANRRA